MKKLTTDIAALAWLEKHRGEAKYSEFVDGKHRWSAECGPNPNENWVQGQRSLLAAVNALRDKWEKREDRDP